MGIKYKYEEHHHVTYTDEAVRSAVALSDRYMPGRHLPDKGDRHHGRKRLSRTH